MKSLFAIVSLLWVSIACSQDICGYYGTLPAEKRRTMAPFASAKKVVLISFFSSAYNEKILDSKGSHLVADDSLTVAGILQMQVKREFDISHLQPNGKTKKYAALEVVDLPAADKDSLSRWFFNYRPKKAVGDLPMRPVEKYTPRNAVLFMDGNRVIAYIEVCFECSQYRLFPHAQWFNEQSQVQGCEGRYEILKQLFRRKGIGYGVNFEK